MIRIRVALPFSMVLWVIGAAAFAEDANKSEGYQFDANAVLRDPFEPPVVQRKGESETEEILRFDLKEIKIVAIMKGIGSSKVMMKLPNNRYHILQQGDPIGKNGERIFEIQENAIVFEKTLVDFKGNKKVQRFSMNLDEKK